MVFIIDRPFGFRVIYNLSLIHISSQWACIISIAEKLGMTPETLRKWVRTAEDAGEPLKDGMTAAEHMKQLERENKELKRSNEILKRAAAFFGAELDRQQK